MAWSVPLAVALFLLGLAFLAIFRREIAGKIRDIRSIGREGVRLGPLQQEGHPERDPRAEAEALMRAMDNALLLAEEGNIRADLGRRNLLGVEGVPVLIRYLAGTRIAFGFEVIYRLIYGSQLNLLQYLNTHPEGEPAEALRAFYGLAATQYPDGYSAYPFERWLAFLRDLQLVQEQRGRLQITLRGRELLAYLTRQGYPLDKVL